MRDGVAANGSRHKTRPLWRRLTDECDRRDRPGKARQIGHKRRRRIRPRARRAGLSVQERRSAYADGLASSAEDFRGREQHTTGHGRLAPFAAEQISQVDADVEHRV